MSIGPVRIILINSGKYNYADIIIDTPVHLAGSNNAGKTTIISALQWLYIDNENCMSFSHTFAKTKNYYFKDQYSYILFECLTIDGYKTIGVRGTGLLAGAHERFLYHGRYLSSDFFNADNTTKNNDEIKTQLASKQYTTLTSSLLSAALTGIGLDKSGAKNLNLGLVPTLSHNGYIKFRKIYHNLLNLSNVDQHELTKAIIHICENKFRSKGAINLEESYTERYAQVQKKRDELKVLENAEKYIKECLRLNEERLQSRSDLKVGYQKIKSLFQILVKKNSSLLEDIKEDTEQFTNKLIELDKQLNSLKELHDKTTYKLGAVDNQVTLLEKNEKQFSDYNSQLEEHIISGLTNKIKDIDFKLTNIDVEPLEIIEKRILKNEKSQKKLVDRFQNLRSSLAATLQQYFTDRELSAFFSLCNHDLLGYKTDGGNLTIKNIESLVDIIKKALKKIDNGHYEDEVLKIYLTDLAPDLSSFTDPQILEKEIAEIEYELAKDRTILKNALGKKNLLKQRRSLDNELADKRKRHELYLIFIEKREELSTLSLEKTKLLEKLKETNDTINTYSEHSRTIRNDIQRCKKSYNFITSEEARLKADIQSLKIPENEWQIINNEFFEDDLKELITNHKVFTDEEIRLSREFDINYNIIDSSTYSAYTKNNELSTLHNLKEEVENIEKLKSVIESRWTNLIHALGTNMRDLLMDLDTIKSQVHQINRDISKMQISDLKSVKIRILDTVKLTHIMNAIVERSTNSLFSTTTIDETASAIEELQRLFQTRGKIDISDLFSIAFEVTKASGETDTHTTLDSIESEGTTITIKVLVNLLLLKGIIDPKKDVSLPFYLDEVGRLDADNVRSIISQAQELGFTPIIASPEPSDIVNNIYLLRSGPGGLYVDERNLINIKSAE